MKAIVKEGTKKRLGFVLITAMVLVGLGLYKRYAVITYDSSSDGSEIAEEQQQIVPPDVAAHIEQEKLLAASSSSPVLGTQTNQTAFPIPVSVHVPILMYHYVEYVQDKNDTIRISLNTTPYTLENEIKTLRDAGYTFMTNKELTDVFNGEAQLPPKPILLTFDDGYRDFYTDAYPILKKYQVKATQYVISGFLGYQNHLLKGQLQEIAQDGLVEIGAHTVHHVWLKGQLFKTVADEIFQSKASLEKLINKPVVSFAYPFGAFDQQVRETVRNFGFSSALSTIPGAEQKQENKYFLYRLRPGGRTGKTLLAWLENQK